MDSKNIRLTVQSKPNLSNLLITSTFWHLSFNEQTSREMVFVVDL